MNLTALIQSELQAIQTERLTEWFTHKSRERREYQRMLEDFKAIVIMQQAGFYEQADARFEQWKTLPMPAEVYRYRLAIAGKAGGKRIVQKRLSSFPMTVQNHPQLKDWKRLGKMNQWWIGGAVAVVSLILVWTQLDSEPATTPVATKQTEVEQQLAALQREVEQLKEKNEQLASEQEKAKAIKPEKKEAKTETQEPKVSAKDALEQGVAAVQAKDYKRADSVLTGSVLTNKETAGMARFYKLITAGKLKQTTQADYIAYRKDFPKSGYMSDVLWMQAVYEQKYKKGDYRATLQELAKQPDNEWSYAAKAILSGKSTLGN
ncbi:hypothetical protein [Exiguobacterium sp. s191]|uniref:hypothetical protein n=1 Tax=Exiguobacterium sp. s191 TaxID=2751196 RepID=UPI001BE681D3|nr:hypothetical protein [Exiguobacterium sp. s191]